jgi:hypothetical protein
MDTAIDIKYWNESLSKKIEQLQNRGRINGYNTWVLFAALALLINKFFSFWMNYGLPEYPFQFNIIWVIVSCFCLLSVAIYSLSTQQHIYKYQNQQDIRISKMPFGSIIVLFIIHLSLFFAVQSCMFGIEKLFMLQAFMFILLTLSTVGYIVTVVISFLFINWLKWPFILTQGAKASYRANFIYFIVFGNYVLMLITYIYIIFSSKFHLYKTFANNVYLVFLIWAIIIISILLFRMRSPLTLIDELSKLQDKILTGGLKTTEEIAKEYRLITVGEKLSFWAKNSWLDFRGKIEEAKNTALIIEKQFGQLTDLYNSEVEADKKNYNAIKRSIAVNLVALEKQTEQLRRFDIKFHGLINLYKNNDEVIKPLIQSAEETKKETKQLAKLIHSIREKLEFPKSRGEN